MKEADSALTKSVLKNNTRFSVLGKITGFKSVSENEGITKNKNLIKGDKDLVDYSKSKNVIKVEFTMLMDTKDIPYLVDEIRNSNRLGKNLSRFVIATE